MRDFNTVLLTTVGAKSGVERTSRLGGFADGDGAWLIVASNMGLPAHPAWFVNLTANPDRVWLDLGNRKFRVAVELLQGAERMAALGRVAGEAPRYGEYQRVTDREIPVIRLTPAV